MPIKKPSEIEVTATLAALIYGAPGSGKTTLALSAPAPVLLDFDGGINRIDASHWVDTDQVKKWEDVTADIDDIITRNLPYKTIVIDTVGKMLLFMEDYIKRNIAPTNPALTMRDGSLSLKGFGVRKQMFIDFNNRLKMSGRHVIYVAHEVEKTRRVDKDEVTVHRPDIGGSSVNDLIKELDLMGYMQLYGNRRVISFDPQEMFWAKNSCGMYGAVDIPNLVNADGTMSPDNTFFCSVVDSFMERLEENKTRAVEFESLSAEIKERADAMQNADDANGFVEWVKTLSHVFNSKALALACLNRRSVELGLTYDRATKKYKDGKRA